MYISLPIVGRCRLRYDSNDPLLFYCKNSNLIYAIKYIGKVYGAKTSSRTFTDGVIIIKSEMRKKGCFVSESAIRRLARPNYKKKHVIKVPRCAEEILLVVISLIHQSREIKDECKERNYRRCKKSKLNSFPCFHFLVDNLIEQLTRLYGTFADDADIKEIFENLKNHTEKCN